MTGVQTCALPILFVRTAAAAGQAAGPAVTISFIVAAIGFTFSTFLVQINFDPDFEHTNVVVPTLVMVPAFLHADPTFSVLTVGAALTLPIKPDDNTAIIKARRNFVRTQELKHYEWSVCKGHIARL